MRKLWTALLVLVVVGSAMFVRWFIRIANQAPGHHRERRPKSVDDYRRYA